MNKHVVSLVKRSVRILEAAAAFGKVAKMIFVWSCVYGIVGGAVIAACGADATNVVHTVYGITVFCFVGTTLTAFADMAFQACSEAVAA